MTGRVDMDGRALMSVRLRHPSGGRSQTIDVWIDTAFTGDLLLPSQTISDLGLPSESFGEALLADGSPVQIKAYTGVLSWFGKRIPVEAIASDARFPLLGTGLLRGRVLHIDYAAGALTLD